ncbi:MAG: hypothetical protein JWO36_759, partial [Myxococcales bacterium]|nr:hypothetical protein [Myxococcales bacterium]
TTFLFFYDPMTDTVVALPKTSTVNTVAVRTSFFDANGDLWVSNRNNQYGKLDVENQTVVNPVVLSGIRPSTLSKMGSTTYAIDRNNPRFGTFDTTSLQFTSIAPLVCCGLNIVNDGTTMYLVAQQSISTINTTTGARGTTHTLTPAGQEISEMRFLGTTLYASSGPRGGPGGGQNVLVSINPTTGAIATVHTFPVGTFISGLEVFNP